MAHYFRPNPHTKKDVRIVQATFGQQSFYFFTNAGVFSKKGVDFGSRLLIETVPIQSAKKILDLGCGYGPIGISIAAMHPTTHVTMVDVNPLATELAQINASKNHVEEQTSIFVSDGFSAIMDQQFDLILLNPPIRAGKSVVYKLFAESHKHLYPNGRLCIVIRKQQGAESAKKELINLFNEVTVLTRKKGYWIIQAQMV